MDNALINDIKKLIDEEIDLDLAIRESAEKLVGSLDFGLTDKQKEQLLPVFIKFADETSKEMILATFVTLEQLNLFEIIRK